MKIRFLIAALAACFSSTQAQPANNTQEDSVGRKSPGPFTKRVACTISHYYLANLLDTWSNILISSSVSPYQIPPVRVRHLGLTPHLRRQN